MNILTNSRLLILIALSLFIAVRHASAQQNANLAPLGFTFGISVGDAEKLIKTNGKRIIEDSIDSKKIRTIVMQGMIVKLPLDLDGKDVSTGLEFYDKKLLSSSLILAAKDNDEETQMRDEFIKYLTDKYGKPENTESVLSFETWTWIMPDVRLIFNTNDKNNELRMVYTYEPVNQAKRDKELDKLRGTEEAVDPAKEMFMKGDYSKPKYYDETGH